MFLGSDILKLELSEETVTGIIVVFMSIKSANRESIMIIPQEQNKAAQ